MRKKWHYVLSKSKTFRANVMVNMIQEVPQEPFSEIADFRKSSGGLQCQRNLRNPDKENLELD